MRKMRQFLADFIQAVVIVFTSKQTRAPKLLHSLASGFVDIFVQGSAFVDEPSPSLCFVFVALPFSLVWRPDNYNIFASSLLDRYAP